MPRLLVLCLRRRRSSGSPPGRLLVHSNPSRRQQPASPLDVAVGLVVIFMTFLTPYGSVLGNLNQLRRE
ncbi:cytochrome c oxidase subunit 8C [Phyllostomus discolor]|uniref:Cytochrome c oxidase subunit 8C n=1 Tax=Phyllostomus discolor TaxID=89673 RepID=A0A834EU72_9CHIR|nr:cytochrome c oxidase subunit 8C [Phyllostomus discolor]